MEQLDGRVAVVTGASRGIGRAICETLTDRGARVAGLDLEAPRIDTVFGVAADVTDADAVDEAFTRVEDELGPVDLLVANAGIFVVELFEDTTLTNWRRTLDVNLTGAFICCQRAVGGMGERGYGRIVAVGSSAGVNGGSNSCAAYAASKAGVMCLTKSIANEYARTGITANSVAPALIDTPMMGEQPAGIEERIPVGRLGRPEEVAALVAFLCSEQAGFITGEVVDINGGWLVD